MDAINPTPNGNADSPRRESDAERLRRLAWEAEMIAEADAEIEAGLYVDADDVDTWIDSIGTDHEAPPPPTRCR
jgi:predicted transcriptional regulator